MSRIVPCLILLLNVLSAHPQRADNDSPSRIAYALLEKLKQTSADSMDVSVSVKNMESLLQKEKQLRLLSRSTTSNIIIARIKTTDIKTLASSDNILFISELHIPKEELTTGAADLTLNKLNYV